MTTEINQAPFSETSLDFTSEQAKVELKSSDSLAFGYEDFTIESWVYCTDLSDEGDYLDDKTIFGTMSSGSNKQQFLFYIRHSGELGFWNGYEAVGGGKLENNKWHHVALVRPGNLRIYIYLDGILEHSSCNSIDYTQKDGFSVGAVYDPHLKSGPAWSRHFNGYMQDLRVSSHAVYTSNFVLPDEPLEKCPIKLTDADQPKCLEIALSIKSDTTDESDGMKDDSFNDHSITRQAIFGQTRKR